MLLVLTGCYAVVVPGIERFTLQVLALDFDLEGTRAVTASKDGTWAVWNINVRYAQDEDPKVRNLVST